MREGKVISLAIGTFVVLFIIFLNPSMMWYPLHPSTAPIYPEGTPPEVSALPIYTDWNSSQSTALFSYAPNSPIKIQFDDRTSILGLWYGSYPAEVKIKGTTVDGTPEIVGANWGDTISFPEHDEFDSYTPSFDAKLPLSEDDIHSFVRVEAKMTVTSPIPTGGGHFEDRSATLERQIDLYIVTPQEMQTRKDLDYFTINGPPGFFDYANIAGCAFFLALVTWVPVVFVEVFILANITAKKSEAEARKSKADFISTKIAGDPLSQQYAPQIRALVAKYENEGYGDPYSAFRRKLEQKVTSGRTEQQAIEELMQEKE